VELVDVRIPRLRRLLLQEDLASFSRALEAGEEALEHGAIPEIRIDLSACRLHIGAVEIRPSRDQMIWLATLAIARKRGGDGWVDVRSTDILKPVYEICRQIWWCEEGELSDAYCFHEAAADQHPKRLGPIRSRLKTLLKRKLAGHPHRALILPEKRRLGKVSAERLGVPPERLVIGEALEGILTRFTEGTSTSGLDGDGSGI
jgi:hypothetical protein